MISRRPPSVLPDAPADLVAVAIGGEVILAWTERGAGGIGFRIERADGIGQARRYSEIGRTGPYVAAFRDGSVRPRTTYSYRVHAWNASGDSPPSNVVEVTTPRADADPQPDKE